jgi:hypothetical protein
MAMSFWLSLSNINATLQLFCYVSATLPKTWVGSIGTFSPHALGFSPPPSDPSFAPTPHFSHHLEAQKRCYWGLLRELQTAL